MEKIKIENCSFAYSKTDKAIKNINLSIEEGEWVSIIGHNGSGKSTLSKLLIGLLEPDKGKIWIDGEELTIETVHNVRKKIGIVFQNPDNQFVGVTVKHDIAFGLENREIPREEMLELVNRFSEKVGMKSYLDKEPYLLSGGEKQRVAIAGILACDSDIIILDEATSMLDPEGRNEVVSLIKELKTSFHKTVITITHDLDLASISDWIVVLNNGSILMDGTPFEVFNHPKELQEANLDIPFNLKLYNRVLEDSKLSKDERLVSFLWQLSSTK